MTGAQDRPRQAMTSAAARTRLALGMTTFGSATPVSKLVTNAMPVFVGSVLRVAIGAAVLLPLVGRDFKQIRCFGRRDWILVSLIAVFGMFGFSALMLYGMQMVSGVIGAIVMSSAPAVTAAASMLFMGDKPSWRKLLAIALAIGGILLLHLGQSHDGEKDGGKIALGSALIFGAVCCEACYTLLGKKLSETKDPTLVAFLAASISIPFFVPFAVWQVDSVEWSAVSLGSWAAVVWYGAGTLALGTWLWYSGLAKVEGAVAAGFMGLMPASALILSYVLLGESFEWLHLVGFGVVFLGVVLISWEHARMSGQSAKACGA